MKQITVEKLLRLEESIEILTNPTNVNLTDINSAVIVNSDGTKNIWSDEIIAIKKEYNDAYNRLVRLQTKLKECVVEK